PIFFLLFFFNDPATTEIYTLSLHDALPISQPSRENAGVVHHNERFRHELRDRKSTRLNSSHDQSSYAVFCLKKKKKPSNRDLRAARRAQDRASRGLRISS